MCQKKFHYSKKKQSVEPLRIVFVDKVMIKYFAYNMLVNFVTAVLLNRAVL